MCLQNNKIDMDNINIDNFKVFVFDLDNTLYLHDADSNYRNEYSEKIKDFLNQLKQKDKILCIATHNKHPNTILNRMHIYHYFDEIIYEKRNVVPWINNIREYTNKKEMLMEIKMKLDVSNDDIIFFDDVDYNVKEVSSIGIQSIKVSPIKGLKIRS